ncbi:MAG: DUF2911 domain-containing protein, partial [Acidobacteriota bacterium]
MMLKKLGFIALASITAFASVAVADDDRPKSPEGMASTQIGDAWIDVSYSRPILRGRENIFGAGEEYGKTVNGGGDYWRAGANATTKIKTGVDLMVGGKKVPAGEYGIVIGLDPKEWTLVLTTQETMDTWQGREAVAKGIMWGSYGYKPDFDVARAPMKVMALDHSVDQMTISFVDVDEAGATLVVAWDKTAAMTRLAVAK